MLFASLALTLLASTTAIFAAPSPAQGSHCSLSKAKMAIPSSTSGTPLATPVGSSPKFVAIAIGTQNYTCSSAGTYTSAGAYAELFDASCIAANSISLKYATDMVASAWKFAPASITPAEVISGLALLGSPDVLGQHYFIANPSGTGLSPKWDFTSASEKGHANAFFVGAKTGDIPSPTDPKDNVDWLSLSAAQGDLASQVFRMETRSGQPPASCSAGSPEIFVRYASQYWFFGGSF